MRVGSRECDEAVARHPFLSEVIAVAFPNVDGTVFDDDVEIEEVGPGDAMYPRSLVWRPHDGIPSPCERPGERRRVFVCLSDATRIVRALCLQEEEGDAVPWEEMRTEVEVGNSRKTIGLRLPEHVFTRSDYGPRPEPPKTLWHDALSLAVVTVWTRPVDEAAFVRSAVIQFALRPEHGFQYYQRA